MSPARPWPVRRPNAVDHATGIRLRERPIRLEKLLA
jgi:hypothetical protein